jgi:G3E family GTPase
MADYSDLIPIDVITGFLGSGKTTLLQRLLVAPAMRDAAVLVNEFGEVGLDHHLISHADESTVLLDSGCLCCAMREDVQATLRDLFSRRERGEIPRFRRVVIETSGLADPVPIAFTLISEPVLQHHFRLGRIVTVIDAVNGAAQLARFPEAVKQAAVADRIVLTKTDLAEASGAAALRQRLGRLNRSAPLSDAAAPDFDPAGLIVEGNGERREPPDWLATAIESRDDDPHAEHTHGVSSFCLTFDAALDWTAFGVWLTMLLNRHGDHVLRVKGMLDVAGAPDPVLINGVQHIVHPPEHLGGWPDDDRRSRLVFIVKDMDREPIERSLATFNALANPSHVRSPAFASTGRSADCS